jgi:hypothetical protein
VKPNNPLAGKIKNKFKLRQITKCTELKRFKKKKQTWKAPTEKNITFKRKTIRGTDN